VLTGIDVSFTGFDAYDVEPKQIPDLFASRPIVVFGKWRGAIGGTIELSGTTGQEPYHAVIDLMQVVPDSDHRALRHLWARMRIGNLSDFGMGDPSVDQVAEIANLGLTYGLLTRYTSFIAVHEIVRRAAGNADDVDHPNPLPRDVSDLAVGVTKGAEPEPVWVVAALLAALACAWLSRKPGTREGTV
jgi:Ca-activated chloride channel family protein